MGVDVSNLFYLQTWEVAAMKVASQLRKRSRRISWGKAPINDLTK